MTTKSTAAGGTESIFASGEVAEQWRRGAAQRDGVTGPASEMMLDLANLGSGSRVLDVAAGIGDQTLMAARRVGPTGYVLATDISTSMLNVATETVRNAALTNVETRIMDAENAVPGTDCWRRAKRVLRCPSRKRNEPRSKFKVNLVPQTRKRIS